MTASFEKNELLAKKTCIDNLKELEQLKNLWNKDEKAQSNDVNLNTLNMIGFKMEYLKKCNFFLFFQNFFEIYF